jgi:hypothetical protein
LNEVDGGRNDEEDELGEVWKRQRYVEDICYFSLKFSIFPHLPGRISYRHYLCARGGRVWDSSNDFLRVGKRDGSRRGI